jgi:hypothetical protein
LLVYIDSVFRGQDRGFIWVYPLIIFLLGAARHLHLHDAPDQNKYDYDSFITQKYSPKQRIKIAIFIKMMDNLTCPFTIPAGKTPICLMGTVF